MDINNNIKQIIITRIGLPFYKKAIKFHEINSIAIIEDIYDKSYKTYTLEIRLKSNQKDQLFLGRQTNETEIYNLAAEIKEMIGCQLQLATSNGNTDVQ